MTSDSFGSSYSSVVQPKDDSDEILKTFYDYCNPLKHIVYERFTFWITRMADSFDNFLTELLTKAKTYDFMASDKMMRDKIVFNISDVRVREHLLRELDLSLVRALNICKTAEVSQKQLEVMEPGTQAVNVITQKSRNQRRPEKHFTVNKPCKHCGGGGHKESKCTAYGKKCRSCDKQNHLSRLCMSSKKVHQLAETSGNDLYQKNYDSFFIGMLDDYTNRRNDKWQVDLVIENKNVRCKLDTGAEANWISSKTLYSLKIPARRIGPTITKLRAFGGQMIAPVCKVNLVVGKEKHKLMLHLISSNDCTILGKNASEALGYAKRVYIMINKSRKKQTLDIFRDVFQGLSTFSIP